MLQVTLFFRSIWFKTQTARSGVERTNHEATVPPTNDPYIGPQMIPIKK